MFVYEKSTLARKALISAALFWAAALAIGWLGMQPEVGWFPESCFTLAADSRLPKWFEIPTGYSRQDLTVNLSHFISGVKVELLGPLPDRHTLAKKLGKAVWHPVTKQLLEAGKNHYPSYQLVNIEGVVELVEHSAPGSIFRISDNAEMIDAMQAAK